MGSELRGVYQHLLISPTLCYLSWPVSLIKSWKTSVFGQDLVSLADRTEGWLNILKVKNALEVNAGKCSLWAHMKKNQKRFLFLLQLLSEQGSIPYLPLPTPVNSL